jgi:pyruvate kinase
MSFASTCPTRPTIGSGASKDIRAAAAARQRFIGIMMDTQGPLSAPANSASPQPPPWQKSPSLVRANARGEQSVDVNYANFVNDINVGDVVLIDNGAIEMKVLTKNGNKVECEVLTRQTGSRRHINLPGVKVSRLRSPRRISRT